MLLYGTVFELTSLLPGSVGSLVTAGLPALETFLHMFLGQNFIYMFLFIGKIFMWLFYWQDLHTLIRLVSIVDFQPLVRSSNILVRWVLILIESSHI